MSFLRFVRHMRGNNSPTTLHPNPGLALSICNSLAIRLRIRDCKVISECSDHGVSQGAFDSFYISRASKHGNSIMADHRPVWAIAQCGRAFPEKRIDRVEVV